MYYLKVYTGQFDVHIFVLNISEIQYIINNYIIVYLTIYSSIYYVYYEIVCTNSIHIIQTKKCLHIIVIHI